MNVVGEVDHIISKIEELKRRVMKEEEELEYKNWIEGILMAAVAVLRVAR